MLNGKAMTQLFMPSRMGEFVRILQVIQRYPPSVGGSQLHVQRISEELVKRGHEVTVVTTSSSSITDVRGLSTAGLTYRNRLMDVPRVSEENGVTVYRFNPWLQVLSYLFTPGLFNLLRKRVKDYDVVHAHCYMYAEPDAAMVAAGMSDTPCILTAHDVVTTYGGAYSLIKKVYDWTLGGITLSRTTTLVALNEENKKQYLGLGCDPKKIRIVPNGIDYETYRQVERDDALLALLGNPSRVVLCISRILKYKGIQHIIDAAPAILERYPDTLFVFLGEDQGFGAELKSQALESDVLNHCLFTGSVSAEKVPKYYGLADVFVLPSVGEGFGLVALEAMSAGLPCVLADHGGLKHVLRHIGGLGIDMEGNAAQQIADHVCSVFEQSPSLEKEQRIIREGYSWAAVAQKLEEVYQEALNKLEEHPNEPVLDGAHG